MTERAATLEEFEEKARLFANTLMPKPSGATLVTLSGALGAGKTAFTKTVAKELGINEHITSPTFVLEKIYVLPDGKPFVRLVHIDAYRLQSAEEIGTLGLADLLQDAANLIFLEWPENVEDALPKERTRVTISVGADNARSITYA